jgi:TP901 family phage tail tape measure protein
MPENVANLRFGVDVPYLSGQIGKAVDQALRTGSFKLKLDSRNFSGPLGSITGNVREFDSALAAANKRVIAFGASAAILGGTVQAFRKIVQATIDVEKALVDINSVFQLSQKQINSFGRSLFDVARQTGQSFGDVAEAAKEFSRQGLSVADTQKRVRDAMILTRLSGLDLQKSVDGLTTAMNAYGDAGLDTTQIINKLVAVDRSFAISSGGLIEALQRVGSVAKDAGVSMDELNGLITAARQITGREASVIGNSLKTIFTRLERSDTIDKLEALGLAVKDVNGNARPALQVFQEIAKSYGSLGRAQKQQVAELGAGVFQINQFKALLSDLGKTEGLYAQATRISAEARNEAFIANEAYNKSLATTIQTLKTNATQAASTIGELTLKPVLSGPLGALTIANFATKQLAGLDTKETQSVGEEIGKSILSGIGSVLAGPGALYAIRIFFGTVIPTIRELSADVRSVLKNLGGQENALIGINRVLAQGTNEERALFFATSDVAKQQEIVLGIITRQNAALMEQSLIMGRLRSGAKPEFLDGMRAIGKAPRAAGGFVPSMAAEAADISRGVGGASKSAKPVLIKNFAMGGGVRGPIVANTDEWIVPNYANGGSAIFNKDMASAFGLPKGARKIPMAAGGFMPVQGGSGFQDGAQAKVANSLLKELWGAKSWTEYNKVYSLLPSSGISKDLEKSIIREASRASSALDTRLVSGSSSSLGSALFPGAVKANYANPQGPLSKEAVYAKNAIPSAPSLSSSIYKNPMQSSFTSKEAAFEEMEKQRERELKKEVANKTKLNKLTEKEISEGMKLETTITSVEKQMAEAQQKRLSQTKKLVRTTEDALSGRWTGSGVWGPPVIGPSGSTSSSLSPLQERLLRAKKADAGLSDFAIQNTILAGAKGRGKSVSQQIDEALRKARQGGNTLPPEGPTAVDTGESMNPSAPGQADNSALASSYYSARRQGNRPSTQSEADLINRGISDRNRKEYAYNKNLKNFLSGGNITEASSELIKSRTIEEAKIEARKVLGKKADPKLVDALARNFARETVAQYDATNKAAFKKSQEIAAQNLQNERTAKLDKRSNQLLMASFGASFASSFIPEGQGGTSAGKFGGFLSGALQGVGVGATIGSFAGPAGIAPGAAIGAALGSITGLISKISKSSEEMAKEYSAQYEGVKNRLSAITEYTSLLEQLEQAKAEGFSEEDISSIRKKVKEAAVNLTQEQVNNIASIGPKVARKQAFEQGQGEYNQIDLQKLVSNLTSEKGILSDLTLNDDQKKLLKGLSLTGEQKKIAATFRSNSNEFQNTGGNRGELINQGEYFKFLQQVLPGVEKEKLEDFSFKLAGPNGASYRDQFFRGLSQSQGPAALREGKAPGESVGTPGSIFQFQNANRGLERYLMSSGNDRAASQRTATSARGALDLSSLSSFLPQEQFALSGANIEKVLAGDNLLNANRSLIAGKQMSENRLRTLFVDKKAANVSDASGMGMSDFSKAISDLRNKGVSLTDIQALENAVLEEEKTINTLTQSIEDATAAVAEADNNIAKSTIQLEIRKRLIATQSEANSKEISFAKQIQAGQVDFAAKGATIGYRSRMGYLSSGAAAREQADLELQQAQFNQTNQGQQSFDIARLGIKGLVDKSPTLSGIAGRATDISSLKEIADALSEGEEKRAAIRFIADYDAQILKLKTDVEAAATAKDRLLKETPTSFSGGFENAFRKMSAGWNELSDVGEKVANSIGDNLSGAFGDFVTGAKSAKDAFKSFVTSVLNDAARAFASKAVQSLIFGAGGAMFGGGWGTPFASGGGVASMLTGGEFVFTPEQVKRVGPQTLKAMNGGYMQKFASGGHVRGGSGYKDDVSASLRPGSFVMKKSAVQRYGSDYMQALANGTTQNRWLGGLIVGGLMGGALGYATGGKKGALYGAIAGAAIGGIGQHMYESAAAKVSIGSSNSYTGDFGEALSSTATKTMSPMSKIGLGLGAAALLGGASALLNRSNGGHDLSAAEMRVLNSKMMAEQQAGISSAAANGQTPMLQINPQGGMSMLGYGYVPSTRRFADGDGPTSIMASPIAPSGNSSSGASQVYVTINNTSEGASTSTSTKGGVTPEIGRELGKFVEAKFRELLANSMRNGGELSQRNRFLASP